MFQIPEIALPRADVARGCMQYIERYRTPSRDKVQNIQNSHFHPCHHLLQHIHLHRYNFEHPFAKSEATLTSSEHILGQRIDSHSSEQSNLTGSLDPLPDLFVLFPLLTGLVDGVNVFVGELNVADGEVPSETVGAGRGGDEDGSARKV